MIYFSNSPKAARYHFKQRRRRAPALSCGRLHAGPLDTLLIRPPRTVPAASQRPTTGRRSSSFPFPKPRPIDRSALPNITGPWTPLAPNGAFADLTTPVRPSSRAPQHKNSTALPKPDPATYSHPSQRELHNTFFLNESNESGITISSALSCK